MTFRRANSTVDGLKAISTADINRRTSTYSVALVGTESIVFAAGDREGGSGSGSHLRKAVPRMSVKSGFANRRKKLVEPTFRQTNC